MDMETEYRRRLAEFTAEYGASAAAAQTRLLGVMALVAALGYGVYRVVAGVGVRSWLLAAAVALLVLLVVLWQRARKKTLRAVRLVELYERALGRIDGTRGQSGLTGEEFAQAQHLYARDLDVLGENSLFGLLATTRTALGQRALARLLLGGASTAVTRVRQAAVRELAPMLELRERVALLGWSSFEQLPAESFERWLAGANEGFALWMRWCMVVLTTAWMAVLGVAAARRGDMGEALRNAAAVLAVQGAFALWLRPRVVAELEASQKLAAQMAILRDGLRVLGGEKFEAEMLCELQKTATGDAERALGKLARSLMLVEQRAKEWYYAPAVLLGVGTHAAISLALWRAQHGAAMRRWIAAWAEFEALLALATYAAEHAENTYPEMVEGSAEFVAEGMVHPLLARPQAVANDVRLKDDVRFLLVSGSNMAGKSTLLRAMGLNVVLATAGAPVCARSLRMTPLALGASLALVDSLAEGKSKFLAEVERLRDLVSLAREGACMFLIDEIFSGTNSADRRVAAEAVVRGLVEAGAIGALSTHDLALAEMALPDGRNVHMASPVEDDPLAFDYVLKDGVNRTTNALAIVRMLGLG